MVPKLFTAIVCFPYSVLILVFYLSTIPVFVTFLSPSLALFSCIFLLHHVSFSISFHFFLSQISLITLFYSRYHFLFSIFCFLCFLFLFPASLFHLHSLSTFPCLSILFYTTGGCMRAKLLLQRPSNHLILFFFILVPFSLFPRFIPLSSFSLPLSYFSLFSYFFWSVACYSLSSALVFAKCW